MRAELGLDVERGRGVRGSGVEHDIKEHVLSQKLVGILVGVAHGVIRLLLHGPDFFQEAFPRRASKAEGAPLWQGMSVGEFPRSA